MATDREIKIVKGILITEANKLLKKKGLNIVITDDEVEVLTRMSITTYNAMYNDKTNIIEIKRALITQAVKEYKSNNEITDIRQTRGFNCVLALLILERGRKVHKEGFSKVLEDELIKAKILVK